MNKKGDIWISVIIYTLVGLTAIGILLAIVQPRIQEMRDGITIKQTIEALHEFDSSLRSTLVAPGNKRNVEFKISAGKLDILPEKDLIVWSMESTNKFSEPDILVREGSISILTEKNQPYTISLILNYTNVADITFNMDMEEKAKTLAQASSPYILSIENFGITSSELQQIDIKLR
ncbi:MAG: hypothetical protein KJ767_00595 [Nanoarchaeota archaeon]|nr:hypothetical protein [Nanoarchaeota archaeon]